MPDTIFFLTFAFVFAFSGAVTLFLGLYMRRADRDFEENAKKTKAYIIGYRTKDGSQWDYPLVRFFDEGEEARAIVQTGGIKAEFYPPGTVLDIYYRKKENLGAISYEVRPVHEAFDPTSMSKAGNIVLVMSSVFFAVALFFLVIALQR